MAGFSPAMMSLFNLAGWWFLPDQIATHGVAIFHHLLHSRGISVPKRGTPQYVKHLKWTYSIVIFGYLIYSLVDSLQRTPPTFYEILAVRQNATDQDLKLAFRSFAKRYHPDRIGPKGEALFIAVRDAYEALRDPLKRYGYDRFGVEALTWKETTQADILYKGAWKQFGFYIISLGMLLFGSYVQQPSSVIFWRYYLLAALFTIEIQLIILPAAQSPLRWILSFLFPYRVPYQHILFVHQVYVSLAISLTRVFPILFTSDIRESKDPNALRAVAERMAELVRNGHTQASIILRKEIQSLQPHSQGEEEPNYSNNAVTLDEETLALVEEEWECIIVEQTLASHPGIKATWDVALERVQQRRREAANNSRRSMTPPNTMMDINGDYMHTPSKETAPAPSPSPYTGRLLSPDSDDGREYFPHQHHHNHSSPRRPSGIVKIKREKSPSPVP